MPNIWLPDGILPGFKEACLDYFWVRDYPCTLPREFDQSPSQTCYKVELNIFRALALGFHINEEFFTEYHSAADNQLRMLHYFRYDLRASLLLQFILESTF